MKFSPRSALAASISLLALALSAHAEDLSSYKTSDALWDHLEQLKRGPAEAPKSRAEMTAFLQNLTEVAQAFIKQYPEDARVWDAKILVAQLQPSEEKVKTALQAIAATPDAPKEARASAAFRALTLDFRAQKMTPELDARIRAYEQEYPDSKFTAQLAAAHVELLKSSDPAKAESNLRELLKSPNPVVAAAAQNALNGMEVMKKPLDLKFTSVGGEEIDLSKMRGKVVLVDYWATWCGPCMAEVPNVVATFKDLHEKGFEVVGISLDQDKDSLLKVTKEKGMVWPQYFDGKGWQNAISSSFGIQSIPAVWLVNKKGMVVDQDARGEELRSKVEKLLKE